jgi:hypothetical protein
MESNTRDQFSSLERECRQQIARDLERIGENADPLFRELALSRLTDISDEARALRGGEVVFQNTETWRAAYEKLLLGLDFSVYRSVAWVRTSDYWRDQAGRRSIRLNYELLDRGLQIERILILPPTLWTADSAVPSTSIRTWIEEQHYRGITLALVREQGLADERDLIRDFGIYGDRATGEQELDEQSRTICFRLSFTTDAVRRAENRWSRLKVFSVSCSQALDLP